MNKLKDMSYKFQSYLVRALYGRNGLDSFAKTVYITAVVLMLINIVANSKVLSLISAVFLGYAIFRMFSRNIPKRYAENQLFLEKTRIPRKYLGIIPMQWRDRKVARYYVCSKCHQQIRVPKGKGKIEISCPKCRNSFIRRT